MSAHYDLKAECFTCACEKSFRSWDEFKRHKLKRKHLHDDFVPQCPECQQIVLEPKFHHHIDLPVTFDHKTCYKCEKKILHTTLTRAKYWKSQLYCIKCFTKDCKPLFRLHRHILKSILWEKGSFQCCVCDQKILNAQLGETIFEHVNPHIKKRDISTLLWSGTSLHKLIQICEQDHVLLSHLNCAQMKTLYEGTMGEFQDKKWLKKTRNAYEISFEAYEQAVRRKQDHYQFQTLPKIKAFIQTNVHPPSQEPKTTKRRSSSVG